METMGLKVLFQKWFKTVATALMIANVAKTNSYVNKRFFLRAIVNFSNNFCCNL